MKIKKKRRIRLRLIHLLLIFGLVYISSVLMHQRRLMKDIQEKRLEAQNKISILEEEIEELDRELKHSDSLEFIEKIAREELGMVKPREIIYIDKGKIKNNLFNLLEDPKN